MGYLIGGIIALAIIAWVVLRRPSEEPVVVTPDPPDDSKGTTPAPPGPDDDLSVPIEERYASSGFPVAVDQPDGPVPGERELPDFQWPQILSVDMPGAPECGLTYPLIYTDLFEYPAGCGDVAGGLPQRQRGLLRRAREQAAVYCYRQIDPDCRGVNEISHSFSHQCFQVDGNTLVGVTITYFFECSGQAAGGDSAGPPDVTEVPIPQAEPNCSSQYHYVAHSVSEILNDCASPDRPAIEQGKERDLLEAAQDHARSFCAGARQESCRIPVHIGHDIDHHCFRSEPEDAWFHTSTIIYFFGCPPTA